MSLPGLGVCAGTHLLNYGTTHVAPIQKYQPLLSSKRDPVSKHINGLGMNKNFVMGPEKVRNKERLRWKQFTGPGIAEQLVTSQQEFCSAQLVACKYIGII
jgi:hypothetical protein